MLGQKIVLWKLTARVQSPSTTSAQPNLTQCGEVKLVLSPQRVERYSAGYQKTNLDTNPATNLWSTICHVSKMCWGNGSTKLMAEGNQYLI